MAEEPEARDARYALGVAVGLTVLPALAFMLGQAVLLAGQVLTPTSGAVCLALSLIGSLVVAARAARSWTAALLVVAVAFAATAAGWLFLDRSYDGQGYQFDAVFGLAHGWSPRWERQMTTELTPYITRVGPWPIYYPCAAWVSSAVQVAAGLPVELAKNQGPIIAAATLFGVYGCARTFGFRLVLSALFAVLAAANPVIVVQLFSRMNDGMLASGFTLTAVLAAVWLKTGSRWPLAGALAAMIYALNLKFSAVPIFVGLSAIIVAGACLLGGLRAGMKAAAPLLIGGILGVVVFGFHPYVENIARHGHPFYPVMGEGARDIITNNRPASFNHMTWSQRLAVSYLAPTTGFEAAPRPRPPFLAKPWEFRVAASYDARTAGFGPLFSGILVVTVVLAGAVLLARRRPRLATALLGASAAVVALTLAVPESWWARYVPQLWLAPILLAAAGFVAGTRASKALAAIVAALMLINTGGLAVLSLWTGFTHSRHIRAQIADMAGRTEPTCAFVGQSHARALLIRKAAPDVRLQTRPLAIEGTPIVDTYSESRMDYGPCGPITPSAASASTSSATKP